MTSFRAILAVLVEHGVDFIVVGGVAGVLHGSPLLTDDIDILYSLDEGNQRRLLGALQALDAVFRGDPRQLRPGLSHLASRGHKLLSTRLGDCDCLATIEEDSTYEDLLPHAELMRLGDLQVRVLSLRRLIEVKEKLARPKDRLALMHLVALRDERETGDDK